MSVKIISSDKKSITLEVTMSLDGENFLQTEELIMDKVNELGQMLTKQAMENLEIEETVIRVKEQKLYAKKKPKNIKPPMER